MLDLTEDLNLTFRLLDDTYAWRQRLVEEIHLRDSDHVEATSTYQIALPRDVLRDVDGAGSHSRARILLPITTRQKRPLLQFGIDGPGGGSAALLLRAESAKVQGDYLAVLVSSSHAAPSVSTGLPLDLLRAICEFTPGLYKPFATTDRLDAYAAYLTDGLSWRVDPGDLTGLIDAQDGAGSVLRKVLREPGDEMSSSEQVLLATPLLADIPRTVNDLGELVHGYKAAIDAAEAVGDDQLLVALADYGRRWELLAEVEIPLRERCQVTVSDSRPVSLEPRGRVRIPFALGDARSAHLEVRVDDPHVVIDEWDVQELGNGQRVGLPILQAVRHTRESFSIYSADRDRPYYVEVPLRLGLIRGIRLSVWFVAALTLLAIGAALTLPGGRDFVALLTLLTLPTTFAVAFVLNRESSALAVRLQARPRLALGALAGVLWIITIARLWQQFGSTLPRGGG